MKRSQNSAFHLLTRSLVLGVVVGGVIYGCAGGGGGGGGGTLTPDLQAKKVASEADALSAVMSGDYYRAELSSDYPNGSKGQSYAGEYNMTGSKAGISASVTMRAAYTPTDLYIAISWLDPTNTNDLNRRRFLFNGPDEVGGTVAGWSSQLNDDKFAMAFDVNGAADGTGTFANNGCTVGCHGSMNPESGVMDVWHWKTSRSNPLGYVNDQFADNAGRRNDGGDPIEVRNWKVSGDIASGPGNYWNPTSGAQTVTLPNPLEGTTTLNPALFLLKDNMIPLPGDAVAGQTTFNGTCSGCHSPISNWTTKFATRGLNQTDAQIQAYVTSGAHPGAGAAGSFTATDWANVIAMMRALNGVPGYYLQTPTLSSADLVVMNSKTVYKDGRYTVIFRRALTNGNADDVQFDLTTATEYVFGIAVMDKDGKNHAGKAFQLLKFLP